MVKDLTYREEVFRKIVHVLGGAIAIPLGMWVESRYGMGALNRILLVVLLISLMFDYYRNELGMKLHILKFLQRKREVKHLHAVTLGLMATLISLQFFDRSVVLAALLMFFLGDAAAALIGKKFGKFRVRNKSVEGSIAMLVVSFFAGYALVPFGVALVMAVTATIVEFAVDIIDDSLVIILFGSFVGDVVLRLLS